MLYSYLSRGKEALITTCTDRGGRGGVRGGRGGDYDCGGGGEGIREKLPNPPAGS